MIPPVQGSEKDIGIRYLDIKILALLHMMKKVKKKEKEAKLDGRMWL